MGNDYTMTVRLDLEPPEAESRIREALAEEGFGILTEVDVQQTLRAKLGVDMAAYTILGACNPPLAHRAIEAEEHIGALLPCNVLVRAHPDGGTEIAAADPRVMLGVADGGDELETLADEATAAIRRALDAVA